MVVFSIAFVLGTFLAYRICLLGLPFFTASITKAPIPNLLAGLASDISIWAFLAVLVLPFARWKTKWAGVFWFSMALICWGSFAAHLRYVEHFGMSVRPFHMDALTPGEMSDIGVRMVFESWYCWAMLIGSPLLTFFVTWPMVKKITGAGLARFWLVLAGMLIVGVLGNSMVIQLRILPGMHHELRYNPLPALYYSFKDDKKIKSLPLPSVEQRLKVRELMGTQRDYADQGEFPLWQSSITNTSDVFELSRQIKDRSEQSGRPPNVFVIMVESFRAKEVGILNGAKRSLTPEFDRLANEGLLFTEAYGIGLYTHFGQTATQCSLYGVDGFTIMRGAPMTHASCLGDIFYANNYRTHYFYGADNHFDNQDVFYTHHKITEVHDEGSIKSVLGESTKGGWGYSDKVLYDYSLEVLEKETEPFYSVVMTLSNHSPWTVPNDSPEEFKSGELPEKQRLVQYTDWALGRYIDAVRERWPHTLIVVTADHGRIFGEESVPAIPDAGLMRQIARVPLLILPPKGVTAGPGVQTNTLVSIVDIPPTILNLLSWTDRPQQFMGMDALARTGPVYMDWQNNFLTISQDEANNLEVSHVDQEAANIYGALSRFNLLLPKP